jgi:Mrp family chromosome partitioning ATPase
MGRMIDILRTADRRPVAEIVPTDEPNESRHDEVPTPIAKLAPIAEPALEDDDGVPFIEVGGPRETSLRLVPAAEPTEDRGQRTEDKGQRAETLPLSSVLGPLSSTDDPLTLFTIRFHPVHAARLGGRSPVAELIAFHQPDHPISVQYRSLAAEIARQLPGTLPRVLLFTGAAGNVGTSTVLLNLAMTLARQDAKVTVADAHLARPALAARLGLPDGPGLREVLAGQMPPAWCLQETAHPNLLVLPAGTAGQPRDGADLNAILEMLRDRSDCVLLDAGPWGEGAIATDLAAGSDAVYLVLSHEAAGTPATATLQEEILEQTGRLRGCVLTQR